jgi:pilin isopeptide linkage protein
MSGTIITQCNRREKGRLLLIALGLLLACALGAWGTPSYAASPVTFEVEQDFVGAETGGTYTYRLTPASASAPLPAGASGFSELRLTGVSTGWFEPIVFENVGVYSYDISNVTPEREGLRIDRSVYRVDVYVDNVGGTLVVIYKETGEKTAKAEYRHGDDAKEEPATPPVVPDETAPPPPGSDEAAAAPLPAGPVGTATPLGGTDEPAPPPVGSDEAAAATSPGAPPEDIPNGNVPLSNLSATGVWSLLSLLFSLFAIVGAVRMIVSVLRRRRSEDEEEDENAARADTEAQSSQEDARRKRKALWAFAVILGVLTPIVWLILDDLRQPMAWVNKWTLYIGLLFLAHLAVTIIYESKQKKRGQEAEPPRPAPGH